MSDERKGRMAHGSRRKGKTLSSFPGLTGESIEKRGQPLTLDIHSQLCPITRADPYIQEEINYFSGFQENKILKMISLYIKT